MNVKAGQKAVIIKSRIPSNLGCVVSVVEAWGDRDEFDGRKWARSAPGDDHVWLVESMGRAIVYAGEQGTRIIAQAGPMQDHRLSPLVDTDEPQAISVEEPEAEYV